ncbi:amidohydrolase family protein [Aquipseudomonas ullengensis]|uniref:Amidohydrolase family protein n=1 Tax=Aquipseudomonas ullengensis TaxID=2759166 RepID=A0A7W4LKJ3_9GAMM|nr:amidohydrolase family protein [Pseudomonas ullengensis]MBB2494707.1 amidohydrolase family protein [Pseudomonas ullengensis]
MPAARAIHIRQARLLCLDDDDRRYDEADLLILDGRIAAIGPVLDAQVPAGAQVIEGKGLLAMPGLINAHFHSPGNFLKGQLDSLPLEVFMLYEVPPLAAEGGAERMAYLRTLLAALEMLQRGITAVHDDAYHVPLVTEQSLDTLMQAYRDAGIRATVAIDQPNVVEYDKYPFLHDLLPEPLREQMRAAPRQTDAQLLAMYDHLISRWHGAEDGRLAAAVSCSAPQRVTPEYLQALGELSRRLDLPFNIHVLETKLQRVLGEEKYGQSLVQLLQQRGVLDERCQIIHSIWVDDQDIALLAASGCVVAHNPVCNLRLGSGVMPFRKLREAGVTIALGTDELCSDDTANLWFAGKTAALIHNLHTADFNQWPQAGEILQSMTRGGACSLRMDGQLGQLKVGACADVILLDMDTWAFTPLNDLVRQLIYCEDGSSVRYTLVNGRVVYADGDFPGLDVKAIRREIRELGQLLQSQHADTEAHAQQLMPYYRAMYDQAHARDVGLRRRLADAD